MKAKHMHAFKFYDSFFVSISEVPEKHQLPLFTAICRFALDGVEPDFGNAPDAYIPRAIWAGMRPQIHANRNRALNGEKGKEYGVLGGAPVGNQNASKQPQNNPKTTPNNKEKDKREKIKDNGNENINESMASDDAPRSKEFIPPTLDEVQAYCSAANLSKTNAAEFLDYYEASGWKLKSGNKMSNWQAAVRNWERREAGIRKGKPANDATARTEVTGSAADYLNETTL